MPKLNDVVEELRAVQTPTSYDLVRRKYLGKIAAHTGRNVIAYYSAWLQKPGLAAQGVSFEITDSDKNGFMATIHGMDRSRGLDLILHTPGGQIAATESLVDYLRSMFSTNIRAIVPQISMSAGTMLALSCNSVLMGKHSSLGPIDPHLGALPAHAVVEEFEKAGKAMLANPGLAMLWQPIIAKYPPTMIGECQKAIDWSNKIVAEWLKTGMLAADPDAANKISTIVKELGDHAITLSHSRHISAKKAKEIGLKIEAIEDDQDLQDFVLSAHHAFIQTMSDTSALKIIENDAGIASFQHFSPA